jgi:photosystem I subunit II
MLQVQYLHPKDGVYPEKVNAGRSAVNANKGRIGENLNPVQIKFSGKMVSVELRWPCTAGAV